MALTRYYDSLKDADLVKDMYLENVDVSLQLYEYVGTAVYANTTTGVSTLTPATSPSWGVNDYQSTVASNLLLLDDANKICAGKVASNAADSITFDETSTLLEEDELTAGTWTASSTYNIWVLTPSSIAGQTRGPFFGFCDAVSVSYVDEKAVYKYKIPRQTKVTALIERVGEVSGGQVDIGNEDVAKALFGAVEYGSQTNQYSLGVGSNPDLNKFYRMTLTNNDITGRLTTRIIHQIQFTMNGNIFEASESSFHMNPFTANILSMSAYPEDTDLMITKRAD
jgi:hypothetical protein